MFTALRLLMLTAMKDHQTYDTKDFAQINGRIYVAVKAAFFPNHMRPNTHRVAFDLPISLLLHGGLLVNQEHFADLAAQALLKRMSRGHFTNHTADAKFQTIIEQVAIRMVKFNMPKPGPPAGAATRCECCILIGTPTSVNLPGDLPEGVLSLVSAIPCAGGGLPQAKEYTEFKVS
jgi:hypothetical protein